MAFHPPNKLKIKSSHTACMSIPNNKIEYNTSSISSNLYKYPIDLPGTMGVDIIKYTFQGWIHNA